MKVLVIVPAYNEHVKLETVAERLSKFISSLLSEDQIQVLIADDGSSDNGPEKLAQKFNFLYFRNQKKMGVGYTIRKAYEFGLENNFDILVTMAGNNKDNPNEIPKLLGPIKTKNADFVQGSRYLPGGDFGNMPSYRMITTRYVHPALFSFVAGKKITDSTNGFRAIKAAILKEGKISLNQEWLNHYELEPYLFCKAIWLGYRVEEVPVSKIYPDKKLGYSKMIPIVSWWSILRPLFLLLFRIKK